MKKCYMGGWVAGLLLSCNAQAFDLGDLLKQESLQQIMAPETKPAESRDAGSANDVLARLAQFSAGDQATSLKQALTQGVEIAVAGLARQDGYWGNPEVRIPLPDSLQQVSLLLNQFGMGGLAEQLQTRMNRAAEAAVPQAQALLVTAVEQMTVEDAVSILTGPDDAATQYFRQHSEQALAASFQPVIESAMAEVQLAQSYDQVAAEGVKYGLVAEQDAQLSQFITRQALAGLFHEMALQERAIRENPLQASGELTQQVFSVLHP